MIKELIIAKTDQDAKLPTRKHPTDAGIDLYALENVIVKPNTIKVVRTGITIEIPSGYVMIIKPKGGANHLIGAGVVDAGYQGEILVKVANIYNDSELVIRNGDPVAQALLLPAEFPEIKECPLGDIHQNKSSRGATGGIVRQAGG